MKIQCRSVGIMYKRTTTAKGFALEMKSDNSILFAQRRSPDEAGSLTPALGPFAKGKPGKHQVP